MKKLLALILTLISPNTISAQTYTQLQWGVNKATSPYQFGANINGTWSNLGVVSSTGVWQIPASNLSGVPALAGPNTWTNINTFNSGITQQANPIVSITPIGNPVPSNAAFSTEGTTAQANKREYQVAIGLTSDKGTGNSPDSGNGDKGAIYVGMRCNSGSIACWSLNPLITIGPNASSDLWAALANESDINNLSDHDIGNYSGAFNPSAPCISGGPINQCYVGNTLLTGSGSNTIDFGLLVGGITTPMGVTSGNLAAGVMTLTWSGMGEYAHEYAIGSQIQVYGISPSSWDGVYTVTSSTPTSVTFNAPSASGSYPGNLFVNRYPNIAMTNRAIVVQKALQEAFEDSSNATTSFATYGSHTYGIKIGGTNTYDAIFNGGGKVGIGDATPTAKTSISTLGFGFSGTASSAAFSVLSGNLGVVSGNTLKLATIGGRTTNETSLGVSLKRNSNGSDWTTSALGLSMDVDSTTGASPASVWWTQTGLGINTSTPQGTLQVNGDVYLDGYTYGNRGQFAGVAPQLSFGVASGASGAIKFFGLTSGDATIRVNSVAGSAVIFELPASNGTSGYALTTNGLGVTSWNILSVAGGGTGLSSGTSGGVPYFSSSSTMASSGVLGANQVVVGGGAGAAPISSANFTSDSSGNVTAATLKLTSKTIATLPTCNAAALGSHAVILDGTDYATGTYGSSVVATGIVTRNVLCTNTAGATTYAWAYN